MIERDPQLSEAYRDADHPAPSPALDAAILDAARRAVAPPPRRRWFAWAAPLATTAVLVLGLSLLFTMQREAPETLREAAPPPPQAAREAAPPAPAAAPADSVAKYAPDQARAPAPAEQPSVANRGLAESVPAPAPATPAPATPARESATQEASAQAGAAPAPRPFPAEMAAVPQPAPASPPPAAAKASADLAERREAAAAPARSAVPAASPGMARLKAASSAVEGPEPWLERIRQLVKEGRLEEARKSLEEWRRRYPDWVVPEDLKGLVISGGGR